MIGGNRGKTVQQPIRSLGLLQFSVPQHRPVNNRQAVFYTRARTTKNWGVCQSRLFRFGRHAIIYRIRTSLPAACGSTLLPGGDAE
jgi:hypothetical protein